MDTVQGLLSFGMSMSQAPTQLENELEQLKAKVLTARVLISHSEWGMVKNKDVVEAHLLQLKHTTYDAEHVLREFEDQALRHKVEDASRNRTGQVVSSFLNIGKHFLLESIKRIRDTKDHLDRVMAEVDRVLSLIGLDRVQQVQVMPTTNEIITASEVFGRDSERDQVISQMGMPLTMGSTSAGSAGKGTEASHGIIISTSRAKRPKFYSNSSAGLAGTANLSSTGNVSVLPIFGIGGMGKTTLAQLIYNDERVAGHFTVRIWVCVSDLFDIERMKKEIIKTIQPNFDLSCGLGVLEAHLKQMLKIQKFLLVLDDIWEITQQQWESFYAPLRNGLEGSMILVTTRHKNIAQKVTAWSKCSCKPVQLEGLPAGVFWEFFKKCAFGKECPESYPLLQEIGQSISSKLRGTPLAAKTLGRLLNSNLTEEHWMTINNSELWEQEQNEGEILPALRLSYLYLPTELRRCFSFCSIFPKDYSFKRHEIVDIWVAEGFVSSLVGKRLEDVGMNYLDDLRDRCLFQTDPKFPNQDKYVMHDLIHDTAQYVSIHECFSMKDLSGMTNKPRHMSVEVDGNSLSTMTNIQNLNKLRSLRFGTELDVEITWFSQLSNILFLSLKGCTLKSLPQSICELNSLRYLDISNSDITELPAKLCCLYSLQVVDATDSELRKVHQDVTKLINLRQLALPKKASIDLSKVHGLGNLSCLQNLRYFTVEARKGAIGELKCMNQLRGKLRIKSISNVRSREQAAEARLVDKKYLKEIELIWQIDFRVFEPKPHENEVIDGLCPNERIECLKIHSFGGERLPCWFNPKDLQNLRSLELSLCPYIETLSIPHFAGITLRCSMDQHARSSINYCSNGVASLAFTHLTSISIVNCTGLKNLDRFLSAKNLPSVKSILVEGCRGLDSIPGNSFGGFVHLQDLKLIHCNNVVFSQPSEKMVLPPSLRRLFIDRCGQLDRSFPSCLEKVASLTILCLVNCGDVELIPLDSMPCINTLKFLLVRNCYKVSSIGGSGILSSIEYVSVRDCPKLTEVQQPYKKTDGIFEEASEDLDFIRGWFGIG